MQGAYLEDYQKIKVILKNNFDYDFNKIHIFEPKLIRLELAKKTLVNSFWHLEYNLSTVLDTHIDYYVRVNEDLDLHLKLGKITRSPLFEKKNYTEEKLGFIYNKEYTEFKLWSPVAKEVILVLPNLKVEYNLIYKKNGVWRFKVYGDLDKQPYYYMVRINDDFVKSLDPYAVSSSANSKYNYVINLENTYKQVHKHPTFSGNLTDSIIMEMHLKDFGYLLPGDESYYKKAWKSFGNIGIDYVKSLGVTHVQILPLNAFEGIDEKNPNKKYNWGYNPTEYFSVTGWYATNPDDPYCRINELKEMIDKYHENDLLVNLDVVFNHVYNCKTFSLNKLVPGYVFRTDTIDFMTNGSGCGNDLATERLMVRRLIVDALKYYTEFYGFNGFRFDLMGLIDIETMKEIESELKSLNKNVILYGEGWQMQTGLAKEKLAFNKSQLPTIGYFNDYFRNVIKGNPFSLVKGFICESYVDVETLKYLICGSDNPTQSLNFIECHDNYTIYDQMSKMVENLLFEKRLDYLRLGLELLMISQGVPFLNLGMEFGRTKKGYDNSYNLPMDINQIEWHAIPSYKSVIDSLKDMISIRKEYSLFRLKTKEDVNKLVSFSEQDNYYVYSLKSNNEELEVIITNHYKDILHKTKGTLIYNGSKCNEKVTSLSIHKPGVYIIKNKKS